MLKKISLTFSIILTTLIIINQTTNNKQTKKILFLQNCSQLFCAC